MGTVKKRSATLLPRGRKIAVVAPGAGTGMNRAVYRFLEKSAGYQINILGQARAQYDHYPSTWPPPEGGPPPDLSTFAQQLVGALAGAEFLIVGSRGGQVVLPTLWGILGSAVPPTVCINGGCTMDLPSGRPLWPEHAATFLLVGGRDYFKGRLSDEQYVAHAKENVPKANSTTALLFVREMEHMPAPSLLQPTFLTAIPAMIQWRKTGVVPDSAFQKLVNELSTNGWSGRLLYTSSRGSWNELRFPTNGPSKSKLEAAQVSPTSASPLTSPLAPVKYGFSPTVSPATATAPVSTPAGFVPARTRAQSAPPLTGLSPSQGHGFLAKPLTPSPFRLLPGPFAGMHVLR